MHIVHIKITLHIQVLVYSKKCSYIIDYGPTQNLCTSLYIAKKYMAPTANQNVHMHNMHNTISRFALAGPFLNRLNLY